MIEILPGVFYDPSKEWYEQDPELIALADQVMQETPKDSQTETSGNHSRMLFGVWDHTTVMGNFEMRVDFVYEFAIESPAFLSKLKHDQVTITQLS